MSFTHTITTNTSYSGADIGTLSVSTTDTQTAGAYVELSESIPDAQTDYLVAFTLDVSQLKLLVIDATGEITIETNSGSVPDNTFTVDEDTPVVWHAGSLLANPLTADVTALYITNTVDATAVTLTIRALYDPTV